MFAADFRLSYSTGSKKDNSQSSKYFDYQSCSVFYLLQNFQISVDLMDIEDLCENYIFLCSSLENLL